jgi:cytochrome P450
MEFLGVPPEDRRRFQSLSEQMISTVDDTHPKQTVYDASKGLRELVKYLEALVAERRSNRGDDLLSNLVAVEEQADRMSTAELLSMAALLVNAGHDTLTGLIGTGTLRLLQNRDQLELLRAQRDLMGTAVEELLRFDPPFQRLHRYARSNLEIGGKSIKRGEPVEAIMAAANRDPTVFSDPDHLDIRRANNPHLGFGRGIHSCLGAPLARVEASVALQILIERFPNLRLAAQPEWNANTRMRQLRSLHVAL